MTTNKRSSGLNLFVYLKLISNFFYVQSQTNSKQYSSFQDPVYEEFGLVDSNNLPCLQLKFQTKIYNFNLNNTDISTELIDFTSNSVKIYGFCALHNEINKKSEIQTTWKINERRKTLKFKFHELFVKRSSNQADELRWGLHDITYSEKFKGRSVSFSSKSNESALISAPLNQKFVCKDRLNITLKNPKYENIILELLPEIDLQPVNTGSGFGSNIYLCDKTRRRTLRDSFQSKMTIFSGFILGVCSISVLIGHSFRSYFQLNFTKLTSTLF